MFQKLGFRMNRNGDGYFLILEIIHNRMNIKKVLGLGFIAALINCEQIAQSSLTVAACVGDNHLPANHPGVYVATPQVHQPPVLTTNAGHVHTPENEAGSQGEGNTKVWKDFKGDAEGTFDGKDANGNNHQVHRWQDKKGLAHETDHWTEAGDQSVHSCHRWFDENGSTHEAVHVTKEDGSVVSEHFVKDKHGHVQKIDDCHNEGHQGQGQQGQQGPEGQGQQNQGLHYGQQEPQVPQGPQKPPGSQGQQGQGQGQQGQQGPQKPQGPQGQQNQGQKPQGPQGQQGQGSGSIFNGASQGSGQVLPPQAGQQVHSADCVRSNLSQN